ncbi:Uncharacterised protein [Enterococcus faecalis]|nr:Uncharacterised protein [Enterococcus faecalis]
MNKKIAELLQELQEECNKVKIAYCLWNYRKRY